MTRPYTKKNTAYWERRKNASSEAVSAVTEPVWQAPHEFVPQLVGDKKEILATGGVSNASCTTRGAGYVTNWAPAILNYGLYPNLSRGIMPFSAEGGYYTMSIPINLATLAYFNIPLVRNTINMLQDFSISPLHIRTQNKTVKAFFTKWFEAINLSDFMAQWFLEYYRSGNVFIYKFNGKIAEDKLAKLKTVTAAKSPEIPIRYILLDPKQVYLQIGPNYKGSWSRMLSTFELQRLRNPQTPEDKQVLKDFPPDIQRQIKSVGSQPWVYAPLDTSRFYYCFYRKQDYEPLAVPMIFPLLNRLEYKLMLEQMDMSLVQTMEQVFLLVTAGSEPDRNKGNPGTNPRYLEHLDAIFKNQTIGRVLVGDYTTKAEWKIPDLKELLGKGKYEQVDKDIRDGLGYAFFGEDKFANASIKAKLFLENLREGRRVFLDNFLRPEVKKICEALGFKNVPVLEFEEIDVQDQTALQRVYVQMAQLGFLTAEELNLALKTGILPDKEASVKSQREFAKDKEEGLYQVQAPAKAEGGSTGSGRPPGSGGTKMPGRKSGSLAAKYSMPKVVETVKAMADIQAAFESGYKKHYRLKKLTDIQLRLAKAAARSVSVNEPREKWMESVDTYIQTPKDIAPEITAEISQIAVEMETDAFTATALWHSKVPEDAQNDE